MVGCRGKVKGFFSSEVRCHKTGKVLECALRTSGLGFVTHTVILPFVMPRSAKRYRFPVERKVASRRVQFQERDVCECVVFTCELLLSPLNSFQPSYTPKLTYISLSGPHGVLLDVGHL